MNFANNLQLLRKKNQLSQEDLAAKLEVSRQAVSKWEGGTGFPEMEKMIQLSELFHCTVDELLKGKVEGDNQKEKVTKKFKKFAIQITIGVMLLILGCSSFCFLSGMENFAIIVFFCFAIVAISILVYSGITHENEIKKISLSEIYTEEDQEDYQKRFPLGITIGVTLILLGVLSFFLLEQILPQSEWYDQVNCGIFLIIIALAMPFLIYNGIMQDRFDKKEAITNKEEALVGKLCGVTMLLATLIYLYCGFAQNAWGTMWYVFPLGGIICGIVSVILGKDQ